MDPDTLLPLFVEEYPELIEMATKPLYKKGAAFEKLDLSKIDFSKFPKNFKQPEHYEIKRRGPRDHCSCCGTKLIPLSFKDYMEQAMAGKMRSIDDDHQECGLCSGNSPGTPGVREPKLGETWENTSGERVRVTQEYKCGTYGGWAMGETADGRHLGMRRGNVERNYWFLFTGPESTVNDILLGNF